MNKEVIKFHQFVKVERGPVNTALIDMLKGQVYQVENRVIDALDQGRYSEIDEFIAAAHEAELLINIDAGNWIPPCAQVDDDPFENFLEKEFDIELHVEQGVDLQYVLEKLKYQNIDQVVYYGSEMPQGIGELKIEMKEKGFTRCSTHACITNEFEPTTEFIYMFNEENNSCWGKKLTVTADGKVRPCIHSSVVIGDIHRDNIDAILEKLEKTYWKLTKDKIEKCKACELKYVCFDCREIAYRNGGDLYSANPQCKYDPYKGTWNN